MLLLLSLQDCSHEAMRRARKVRRTCQRVVLSSYEHPKVPKRSELTPRGSAVAAPNRIEPNACKLAVEPLNLLAAPYPLSKLGLLDSEGTLMVVSTLQSRLERCFEMARVVDGSVKGVARTTR